MTETYQSVADEHGQTLSGDVPPGLSISGDSELLPQLFSNLVENAIRHSPAGAGIVPAAKRISGGIEVVIADNRPGIPPEFREKVFQRFFRLKRSRTTDGTWLGFSLAAEIAVLHRASLFFDNRPGLGVRPVFPEVGTT